MTIDVLVMVLNLMHAQLYHCQEESSVKIAVTFGVENTSPTHANNSTKNFLIPGGGQIDELPGSKITTK